MIGVLKNYYQESPKQAFEPQIYLLKPEGINYGNCDRFVVKMNDSSLTDTIQQIESLYQIAFPGAPFSFFFLDSYYNQQYQGDLLFGKVVGGFSLLALLITCLGIFGLSSFRVQMRTREIGVRKVFGASSGQIVSILTVDFLKLIGVAAVFSMPWMYVLSNSWLEHFASRTQLGLWSFLLPLLLVGGVALLTAGYHSLKAATANPVKTLKHH